MYHFFRFHKWLISYNIMPFAAMWLYLYICIHTVEYYSTIYIFTYRYICYIFFIHRMEILQKGKIPGAHTQRFLFCRSGLKFQSVNLYNGIHPLVIFTQVVINPQARETLSWTKPYLMSWNLSVASPLDAHLSICDTLDGSSLSLDV